MICKNECCLKIGKSHPRLEDNEKCQSKKASPIWPSQYTNCNFNLLVKIDAIISNTK